MELWWLQNIICYAVGTVVGLFVSKLSKRDLIDFTIDELCRQGFIRYTQLPDGSIEIQKCNDKN